MGVDTDAEKTTSDGQGNVLRDLYGVSDEDMDQIHAVGESVVPKLRDFVDSFYDWLETQPEYETFFSNPDTLERVKNEVHKYWTDFFQSDRDEAYVARRVSIGTTHARINLPLSAYFAAMNHSLVLIDEVIRNDDGKGSANGDRALAIAKAAHLDTAVVVQTYTRQVNETLAQQSRSLMEMSTPVTQVWSGVLLLPLVGIIDSKRARDIMNTVLETIAQTRARVFILDVSGVGVVDTAVANHFIQITRATSLMGCESIISGFSPAIAQTIVELGIEVGSVQTTASMEDALARALRLVGMTVTDR